MSIFLFPGQGSQSPGMGRDFYDASAAARAVLDQAAALNPPGFLDTIFSGPAEALNDTRMAQPALLAVEVAIARHLEAAGLRPSVCAGHSLGEIPALVVAGVIEFADAVPLTRERARLMSENVPEGGMAAVMGLAPEEIAAALPPGAQVANYNSPQQTIISGTKSALAEAETSLKAAGAKRIVPLSVSGPFHSELMRSAAEKFTDVLAGIEFRAPATRFVSSVSAKEENDPQRIRELLAQQLYSPVRWIETMQTLGPGTAYEIGPGGVLKGLAKRIEAAPEITAIASIADAEGLTV